MSHRSRSSGVVGMVSWEAVAPSIHILMSSGAIGELRDTLLRRVRVHNPEWTDENTSDPGITVLELLAYTVEGLKRRLDERKESCHPRG